MKQASCWTIKWSCGVQRAGGLQELSIAPGQPPTATPKLQNCSQRRIWLTSEKSNFTGPLERLFEILSRGCRHWPPDSQTQRRKKNKNKTIGLMHLILQKWLVRRIALGTWPPSTHTCDPCVSLSLNTISYTSSLGRSLSHSRDGSPRRGGSSPG